jgi:hypothetical protein
MIAYKFLDPGATGPYSGFSWPLPTTQSPGAWVETAGELDLCRNGIHACRVGQLPYWWGSELWEVELAEPIHDAGQVMVAGQGRLLRRVHAWAEPMLRRYARACAWRARDHGVGQLRAVGLDASADAFLECATLESLAATAVTVAATVADQATAAVIGYVADTASWTTGPMALAKTVPYAAAHAAGCTGGHEGHPEFQRRYHAERYWQSHWLTEHLKLATS